MHICDQLNYWIYNLMILLYLRKKSQPIQYINIWNNNIKYLFYSQNIYINHSYNHYLSQWCVFWGEVKDSSGPVKNSTFFVAGYCVNIIKLNNWLANLWLSPIPILTFKSAIAWAENKAFWLAVLTSQIRCTALFG